MMRKSKKVSEINNNILFLIILIFFYSLFSYSKTETWRCDNFLFKIKTPTIGFNRIYIYKKNHWYKVKKFNINEKDYLIFDLDPSLLKCSNNNCKVNVSILKVTKEKKHTQYRSIVNNKFCKIDGANKCYERKIGKNIQRGYCIKIKN